MASKVSKTKVWRIYWTDKGKWRYRTFKNHETYENKLHNFCAYNSYHVTSTRETDDGSAQVVFCVPNVGHPKDVRPKYKP